MTDRNLDEMPAVDRRVYDLYDAHVKELEVDLSKAREALEIKRNLINGFRELAARTGTGVKHEIQKQLSDGGFKDLAEALRIGELEMESSIAQLLIENTDRCMAALRGQADLELEAFHEQNGAINYVTRAKEKALAARESVWLGYLRRTNNETRDLDGKPISIRQARAAVETDAG